jgi:hypothetical protein
MRCAKWICSLLLLALAACQNPQPIPAATPTMWRVQRTPALAWMGSTFNTCAQQQSGIAIQTIETAAVNLNPAKAAFSLRWGEPQTLVGTAYEIGWDVLVVIVNPSNPVQSLNRKELLAIYNGSARDWKTFMPAGSSGGQIQVWSGIEGDDLRQVFEGQILKQTAFTPFAFLAPSPDAMLFAIAADANAIGYLPARWLNDKVKTVALKDVPAEDLKQPILAISNQLPPAEMKIWLSCLQSLVQPK